MSVFKLAVQKGKLIAPVLGLSFALMACTGSVTNSVLQQAATLMSFNQGQISLVSNSTGGEAQCAASNTVVLQTSIPANQTFYCRDQSQLMSAVTAGQVCPGGVTINPLSVSSAVVNCSNLTICGVPPTSTTTLSQRVDGAPVQQLSFKNLPWGCEASLQYSTDPSFPAASTTTISLQVIPPTCPFCQSSNSSTCLSCAPLGANQKVVDGQVVATSCGSSGTCSPCSVQTLSGTVSVPHGQGYTFYSAPQNTCPGHCSGLSQVRVCNNGLFAGDPQYTFPQCTDAQCGCQLPGSGAIFNSGKTYPLYTTSTPQCPAMCSGFRLNASCLDGTWEDASGNPLTSAQLSQYGSISCQDPNCSCSVGQLSIPFGTSNQPVFNVASVSCGDTCAAHQGAVTCTAQGQLTATDPSFLSYKFSQCTPPVCGCNLPWGGTLANGSTTPAYSLAAATCASPNACQAAANFVSITCTAGKLSAFDATTYKYGSCKPAVCSCMANGVQVAIG